MKYRLGCMALMGLIPAACASAGAPARSASCELSAQDSAYLAGGPVFRDCAVDDRARLLGTGGPLNYRPSSTSAPRGVLCWEAEIQFVVNEAGRPEPETARVVRTNDPGLANALMSALPQYRYEPARKDGTAVRQIVRAEHKVALTIVAVGSGARPPRPNC